MVEGVQFGCQIEIAICPMFMLTATSTCVSLVAVSNKPYPSMCPHTGKKEQNMQTYMCNIYDILLHRCQLTVKR